VFQNSLERPKFDCCSFILPGVPGTRKTSLVDALSKVIRWPLVTVPASVFFDRGFDLIESRANEIFRRLNYLCNCVIFFDEFEEFFRERFPEKGDVPDAKLIRRSPIHDRTIAAFLTASMLPRLQDLHHQGRNLNLPGDEF